jgi:hypothetical protein
VVGFVLLDRRPEPGAPPYAQLGLSDLAGAAPEVVVVSSHDAQYAILDTLRQQGLGDKAYLIYDQNGRSLEFLYPEPAPEGQGNREANCHA